LETTTTEKKLIANDFQLHMNHSSHLVLGQASSPASTISTSPDHKKSRQAPGKEYWKFLCLAVHNFHHPRPSVCNLYCIKIMATPPHQISAAQLCGL